MLEEALKIFNLKEICTLEELDNAYKTLIRKNYDEKTGAFYSWVG